MGPHEPKMNKEAIREFLLLDGDPVVDGPPGCMCSLRGAQMCMYSISAGRCGGGLLHPITTTGREIAGVRPAS